MQIDPVTHLDHGLTPAHLEWLLATFRDRREFLLETVELPPELAPVMCALYGPSMGDEPVSESEVRYIVRGGRHCTSRVLRWDHIMLPRETRLLTVIAGPVSKGTVDKPCVLYTAYGGPAAPREPGDLSIPNWEALTASRAFWAIHALSAKSTV